MTTATKETANVKAEYITIAPARAKRAALKDGGASITGYTVMIRPNGGTLMTIAEYLASDDGKAESPETRRTLATYGKVANRTRAIVAAHEFFQYCISHDSHAEVCIMAKTVESEFASALALCQATDAANAAARDARKHESGK